VVAPTTLLTALLYYFGWAHAYYFFGYFGVNSTMLGFTTTDYLMRCVDSLFLPVTAAAVAVLLASWAVGLLHARLSAGPGRRTVPVLVSVLVVVAATAMLGGAVATLRAPAVQNLRSAIAPVVFASGVLLATYAAHLRRRFGRGAPKRPVAAVAEWAVVLILVGIGLFAAATNYAAAVGELRAQSFAASLSAQPDVVLYSEKNLSLRAPSVRKTECTDPLTAYKFRYEGLKLVLQSGGLYMFLPAAWTKDVGPAILLPMADSVRLEFYTGPARADSSQAC